MVTWEFFLAKFRKKYINCIYLEDRRREFIALRQRQMKVAEYEQKFIRLSKCAMEIVPIEAERCRRFEEGLNDSIQLHILAL